MLVALEKRSDIGERYRAGGIGVARGMVGMGAHNANRCESGLFFLAFVLNLFKIAGGIALTPWSIA